MTTLAALPMPNFAPAAAAVKLSVDDVLKPFVWVFYVAFIVAYLMTPIMRRIAIYYDIVDRPDGLRKVHRMSVAYLGGVAVFLGWLVGIAVSHFCQWHLGPYWSSVPFIGQTVYVPLAIVIGAFLVVLLGLYDDIFHISPYWKIAGQVLAAVTLLAYGDIGTHITKPFIENINFRLPKIGLAEMSPWLFEMVVLVTSYGLTTAIVVFCCNASNLMDGLDGLCGGVTAIIALGLVILAVHVAATPNLNNAAAVNMDAVRVIVALALLGATLGFVPFNFNPASIFMGDAGSLFMGFGCALMIVLLGESEARWLLAAMIMFALPVLDTALAFARRKLAGRRLFSADKQHLHHQLVARGLSVRQAVLIAYALAIFFVLCGVAIVYIRTRYAVAFYLVLFGSIIVAAYKMGMIHERVAAPPQPELGGTGIPDTDATDADKPVDP